MTMRAVMSPTTRPTFERRNYYWIYLFARLKPGVSLASAETGVNAVYHPIITDVEAREYATLSATRPRSSLGSGDTGTPAGDGAVSADGRPGGPNP